MSRYVLGVDPGYRTGGWALIETLPEARRARVVESGVLPVEEDFGRRLDLRRLRLSWNRALIELNHHPSTILGAVEAVEARPSDGRSSAFAFGRSAGALEGLMVGLGLREVVGLPPSVWKARAGLRGGRQGKPESIALATRLTGVVMVEHVAEAALIGWFAALQHASGAPGLASDALG